MHWSPFDEKDTGHNKVSQIKRYSLSIKLTSIVQPCKMRGSICDILLTYLHCVLTHLGQCIIQLFRKTVIRRKQNGTVSINISRMNKFTRYPSCSSKSCRWGQVHQIHCKENSIHATISPEIKLLQSTPWPFFQLLFNQGPQISLFSTVHATTPLSLVNLCRPWSLVSLSARLLF